MNFKDFVASQFEVRRINHGKYQGRICFKTPLGNITLAEEECCGTCKYFQIDGMFGRWCDKGHNWTEVEYCKDWER